ncbi:hypothetical protein MSAN_01175000 [Mycena sanguinolenta]|uniref:C-8 sterol isomerase n=1 Tax=Mycena sanguinolenta TaxID=230812 RepID=A0A8H7D421_9AGAR|nr:hypothetical protein MSAN_01175000 [Mycena sanguinolenta]
MSQMRGIVQKCFARHIFYLAPKRKLVSCIPSSPTPIKNSGSYIQAFLAKWTWRSLVLLLLVGIGTWLDHIKDRWYVFDPASLNALAQSAIAYCPNDTTGMIHHIVANLTRLRAVCIVHAMGIFPGTAGNGALYAGNDALPAAELIIILFRANVQGLLGLRICARVDSFNGTIRPGGWAYLNT